MIDFAIIEAPSVLGLFPGGVERLPGALLDAGLGDCARRAPRGIVTPPPYDPIRDTATGLLNPTGLRDYALALADVTGEVLDRREVPIVLGGDCSILLGTMLALRRRGRYGLLFIDGHADFYQPEAEPNGEAASMDLALATGRGPGIVADLDGRGPLGPGRRCGPRRPARHGGGRTGGEPTHRGHGHRRHRPGGPSAARSRSRHADALEHLGRPELDGFWITSTATPSTTP